MGSTMDTTWYDGFFDDIVVEMWQQAIPPEHSAKEVDFLERALQLETRSSVLDVPCGCGRHALELAARGHALTAIDLSEPALAIARQQARRPESKSTGDALTCATCRAAPPSMLDTAWATASAIWNPRA